MRVVFMGTPEFAVPSLEALLRSEFSVTGVVTQPDRPRGRGKAVSPSKVKEVALAHNLPILQPDKMKHPDTFDALQQWQPEIIAVAAFGRILPKSILDLPSRGCINVHGSLLPRYRGAAPIQWALINGESETGVTTMLMDEGMDTGTILLQEAVPILPEETAGELSVRLAEVGADLLIKTLREWTDNRIIPRAQDDPAATMAPMLTKEDGNIDWNRSAIDISNRIRGLSPWPGAYTFCEKDRLTIWKATPLMEHSLVSTGTQPPGTILGVAKNEIVVATSHGILAISELQPANRSRMKVEQFLSGHRLTPTIQLKAQPTI